jgi:hypothetical protein
VTILVDLKEPPSDVRVSYGSLALSAPSDGVKGKIGRFVHYYDNERVHEALDNLTPADVYRGRGREIQTARERLKEQTLRRRRRYNMGQKIKREPKIVPSLYRESSIRPERFESERV